MITILFFLLSTFALYLYFQSKVKNHSNYPVVYAMLLGFLVYASGSSMPQWIIDNLNAHTTLALTPYEPLSGYKMLGFGVFLVVLVALYVMKKHALKERDSSGSNTQKNHFWSLLNFGKVDQSIGGGDASKENQEELKREIEINQEKLDKLLGQIGNPALSAEEKERLENEIRSLRRALISLHVDDKGGRKSPRDHELCITRYRQGIASYRLS